MTETIVAGRRPALTEAIATLYQVFSTGAVPTAPGAKPTSVSEAEYAALYHTPLRQLSAEHLRPYVSLAVDEWGDAKDLRYFLPRIFEIVSEHSDAAFDAEMMARKLRAADWRNWASAECDAVHTALDELWVDALARIPSDANASRRALSAAVIAGEPLESYFDALQRRGSSAAFRHIAAWVAGSRESLDETGTIDPNLWPKDALEPVTAWLESPQMRKALERAFFESADDELAAEFSWALDTLLRAGASAEPAPAKPTEALDKRIVRESARAGIFGAGEERITLGRYVVEALVGAGGMGQVYRAQDPDLDRRVAIKVLTSSGAPQAGLHERMLREAQAMAALAHPNVATVHEVGEHEGRVFVVMEYLDGGTLRSWASAKKRGWREILDVYLQAGRGLAAAHKAGLVHRDFKPDNALLGQNGRVRVTDFGLVGAAARPSRAVETPQSATGPTHSESTDAASSGFNLPSQTPLEMSLTRSGQLLGTPAYMAPEQHAGREVDARSDLFAFCVSLYEALHGERPFTGNDYPQLIENVSRGSIATLAKQSDAPAAIRAVLLRGLSVAPGDRPPSMEALLDALEKASTPRRWRRFAPIGVALAAAATGLGVYLGDQGAQCSSGESELVGIWDDGQKALLRTKFAEFELGNAKDTLVRIERGLDAYATKWSSGFSAACTDTVVRQVQSTEALGLRMGCLAEKKRDFKALVGVLIAADKKVVRKAISAVARLPRLSECEDVEALKLPYAPPDPAQKSHVAALREQLAEVKALEHAGKYKDGLSLAESALTQATELGYRPALAEAQYRLGRMYRYTGQFDKSAKSLEDAVWTADKESYDDIRARASGLLVFVVGDLLRKPEAGARWARLADAAVDRVGRGGYHEAAYLTNLSTSLNAKGDYAGAIEALERALPLFKKTLGPEHPHVATVISNIAMSRSALGQDELALQLWQQMMAIQQKIFGPDHPELARSCMNIGITFVRIGETDRGLESFERAVAIGEKTLGPEHPDVSMMINNIGETFRSRGAYENALRYYERALAGWEKSLGPKHPYVAGGSSNIGLALLGLGRGTEAIERFDRAITLCENAACPSEIVAEASFGLAQVLAPSRKDRGRALELAHSAEAIWKKMPPKHVAKKLKELKDWLAKVESR